MNDQVVTQMVIVPAATLKENRTAEQVSLFDVSGDPVLPTLDTVLTGLDIPEVGTTILVTDTLLEALGKLQSQINALAV